MAAVDTFVEILILLSYLQKSLVFTSGSSGILKSDQKHRTQKAAEKANELLCYVCQTLDASQNHCYNVTDEQNNKYMQRKCEDDRRICTAKKVSFQSQAENGSITHKTFSIERGCAHRCEPGCITIGERLKLRKCVSCCYENLCNFGNSSPILALSNNVKCITLLLPMFLYFHHKQ